MGISVDDDDQEKREFLPGTEKSFFTLSRAMALDALYLNQVFLREPPKRNKNKQEQDFHVEPDQHTFKLILKRSKPFSLRGLGDCVRQLLFVSMVATSVTLENINKSLVAMMT